MYKSGRCVDPMNRSFLISSDTPFRLLSFNFPQRSTSELSADKFYRDGLVVAGRGGGGRGVRKMKDCGVV